MFKAHQKTIVHCKSFMFFFVFYFDGFFFFFKLKKIIDFIIVLSVVEKINYFIVDHFACLSQMILLLVTCDKLKPKRCQLSVQWFIKRKVSLYSTQQHMVHLLHCSKFNTLHVTSRKNEGNCVYMLNNP